MKALRGKNVEFPEEEGILKLMDLRDVLKLHWQNLVTERWWHQREPHVSGLRAEMSGGVTAEKKETGAGKGSRQFKLGCLGSGVPVGPLQGTLSRRGDRISWRLRIQKLGVED